LETSGQFAFRSCPIHAGLDFGDFGNIGIETYISSKTGSEFSLSPAVSTGTPTCIL